MEIGELRDRIAKERAYGNKLEPLFTKKGWLYSKPNNDFSKGNMIAYFYEDDLIFHFDIYTKAKSHHKIKLI